MAWKPGQLRLILLCRAIERPNNLTGTRGPEEHTKKATRLPPAKAKRINIFHPKTLIYGKMTASHLINLESSDR